MAAAGPSSDALPAAEFIEDVEAFMQGKEVDATIKTLQDAYTRYKMRESRLLQQRVRLQKKLPELKKALDTVLLLLAKQASAESTGVEFQLTDNIFAKAVLQDTRSVCLWLGANVMLEYTLEEAEQLLARNHANALSSLEAVKAEVLALRDSITTTEVCIARVYNWDVSRRRAGAQAAKA